MAILTSSQQTFVDITDQRKLSAYITSNLPKSQIEDPNVLPHTYAPDWASTPLTLTPVVFLDQTRQSRVAWKYTGHTSSPGYPRYPHPYRTHPRWSVPCW